ncbi:hypothetical protein BGZ93_008534 [Podila epicladia]|nr:hypothetical protein BGZ92_004088 [Podila epicladia]KAG0092008.1 hypothetical protein BGZ93_008534 [Podila epicladia]
MVQSRRFHSNVFFFIPLHQGVLLLIFLDFIKNAVNLGRQAKNLTPYTLTYSGVNGDQVIKKNKDPAYLAAQYIYALWLILMIIKAVIGFRANLKFNIRWMGKYNIFLGLDTIFEFVYSTLGIIFQDMSHLDEAAMIRRYCSIYTVLILQVYGFFCCWLHLRWVHAEMPHLLAPAMPRESLLGLMFPMATSTSTAERAAATGSGPGTEAGLTRVGAEAGHATTAANAVLSTPTITTTSSSPV